MKNKYNALEDVNYPKVGDKVDEQRRVKMVDHIDVSKLYDLFMGKNPPKDSEHLLIVDNPANESIKYLVWWEKI